MKNPFEVLKEYCNSLIGTAAKVHVIKYSESKNEVFVKGSGITIDLEAPEDRIWLNWWNKVEDIDTEVVLKSWYIDWDYDYCCIVWQVDFEGKEYELHQCYKSN